MFRSKNMPLRCMAACICVILLLCASLSGCAQQESTGAKESTTQTVQGLQSTDMAYSSEDQEDDWDDAAAVHIVLHSAGASVSGTGAAFTDGNLVISQAGVYVLSGTLADGQILVNAGKEDSVRLVLNGVTVTCSDSAPLYVLKAGKVIVTLAPGSQNSLADGASYTLTEGEDEPNAALFSKSDLTINGSGTLTVHASYHNGIASKDALVITGGTLQVTAVNHGIFGRDSIAVSGGTFAIHAGGDGLQSSNDTDGEKGWIQIDGGAFEIEAANDGIQAVTALTVNGGDFTIKCGGGASAATSQGSTTTGGFFSQASSTTEETESCKGLKAGTAINVNGGTFTLDTADDTVHSNGSVTISGGVLTLATGDDGIHADGVLAMQDGTVTVTKSYEGLEGAQITLSGATVSLTASDDGVNATGTSSTQSARPGQGSSDAELRITGGFLFVDAAGDGLDSNGSLYISGGTVLVCGPTSDGDGALDYDGTCEISGGILIAAGSSGMAQAPGTSSSQPSLMVTFSSTQQAGTLLSLTDEQGDLIAAFAPSKAYRSLIISCPSMTQGQTVTLSSGGSCSGTAESGLYQSGTVQGATQLTQAKLTSVVTSISDNGSTVSGGINTPGNAGGMGRPQR